MQIIKTRSFVLTSLAILAGCQGQPASGDPESSTTDLPAVCDGAGHGTADNVLIMTSPAAMATGVSGPVIFEVDVPGTVPRSDVEQAIAVRTAEGAPIAGAFRWEPQAKPGTGRSDFVVSFTPAGGWPRDTDITVAVSPHGAFNPSHALRDLAPRDASGGWQAAFSTRSSARIALARVVSKDGKTAAYVHLAMSELTPAELIEAGLEVTTGGVVVAGSLDVRSGSSLDYQYTFSQPVPIDRDIDVALRPHVSATGKVLAEPLRWDAQATASGKLTLHASSATACPREPGCWEWRPSRP